MGTSGRVVVGSASKPRTGEKTAAVLQSLLLSIGWPRGRSVGVPPQQPEECPNTLSEDLRCLRRVKNDSPESMPTNLSRGSAGANSGRVLIPEVFVDFQNFLITSRVTSHRLAKKFGVHVQRQSDDTIRALLGPSRANFAFHSAIEDITRLVFTDAVAQIDKILEDYLRLRPTEPAVAAAAGSSSGAEGPPSVEAFAASAAAETPASAELFRQLRGVVESFFAQFALYGIVRCARLCLHEKMNSAWWPNQWLPVSVAADGKGGIFADPSPYSTASALVRNGLAAASVYGRYICTLHKRLGYEKAACGNPREAACGKPDASAGSKHDEHAEMDATARVNLTTAIEQKQREIDKFCRNMEVDPTVAALPLRDTLSSSAPSEFSSPAFQDLVDEYHCLRRAKKALNTSELMDEVHRIAQQGGVDIGNPDPTSSKPSLREVDAKLAALQEGLDLLESTSPSPHRVYKVESTTGNPANQGRVDQLIEFHKQQLRAEPGT